jgi:hypothetical protein
MEKEFVPKEQALALKELGFDKPCFGYYNNHEPKNNHPRGLVLSANQDHNEETEGDDLICSAPLYQQAFRFFREKYSLVCIMTFDDDVKGKWFGNLYGHYETHGKYDFGYTELFKTYEEAELECLVKLIEICKSKKNENN